jgi:anthranilate synthase component 1
MHLVSNVEGLARKGVDALDVLRACFPAGTVSGAPKIRAMEIIETLEPVRRGTYAGAVGYLSFDGNLDTCIAIRTAYCEKGLVHVGSGAGIVADSDPEREYQETMNKAKALFAAVESAERRARERGRSR